jgi:DNA processing protein
LLRELAGHLEAVRKEIEEALELADEELIAAVGGRRRRVLDRRLARVRPGPLLHEAQAAGLETVCRCDRDYPARLRYLPAPPAVLFVAGELMADDAVAIVGARRASSYGLETARSLGRGLAAAGLTVVSGMAIGIDSAAHDGALAAGGSCVAVLPGPAGDPYPRSRRRLHAQIIRTGAAVSELPPRTSVRRWMFIARNRIIAALSAATVVVEASGRSGALVTAAAARRLGRPVGAVPGRITTPQAAGTNELLAEGAFVVRGAQDVLDAAYGIGVRSAACEQRPDLVPDAREVLLALASGRDSAEALAAANVAPGRTLAVLAWLELSGYIRREPGGRFAVIP